MNLRIVDKKIISSLPDGITIRKSIKGYGLYATQQFLQGKTLYTGEFIMSKEEKLTLIIPDVGTFPIDQTHTVKCNGYRQLYGFDGFINHSCEPNTIYPALGNCTYSAIALHDINVGDELTCDYALFDYDCEGHIVERCLCGSPYCRGSIKGFKNLTPVEQNLIIEHVDPQIIRQWQIDNPRGHRYFCVKELPPKIKIIRDNRINHQWKISSQVELCAGDIIYTNRIIKIPEGTQVIMKMPDNTHFLLDYLRHTTYTGMEFRLFYGFDTFQNHCCEPNTHTIWVDDDTYYTVASRAIKADEELTCHYHDFEEKICCNGQEWHFQCQCGTSTCLGQIKSYDSPELIAKRIN